MSKDKMQEQDKRALALMGIEPGEVQAAPAGVHLSEQQDAFVAHFVDSGNKAQAALMAGITEPREIRSLLAHPGVVAAIKAEMRAKVFGNVVAADAAITSVLTGSAADREKIAAAKVAFERAGVLKAAELDAVKAAADPGSLSRLSEGELERIIEATAAKIAARKPGDGVIVDVTPDAETPQPIQDA